MSETVIDGAALRRLLEVIGGDPEDLTELLEDYFEGAPALVAKLQAAAEAGDFDAMRLAAHTLKSNARDFGALSLAVSCEALEQACREGPVEGSVEKVQAIAAQEAAARQVLADLEVDGLDSL
ncbi:MAG: hypothetical protein Kilf2KO_19930 [Rhodospirillales bacterium]